MPTNVEWVIPTERKLRASIGTCLTAQPKGGYTIFILFLRSLNSFTISKLLDFLHWHPQTRSRLFNGRLGTNRPLKGRQYVIFASFENGITFCEKEILKCYFFKKVNVVRIRPIFMAGPLQAHSSKL
jgi:hypothetical protein